MCSERERPVSSSARSGGFGFSAQSERRDGTKGRRENCLFRVPSVPLLLQETVSTQPGRAERVLPHLAAGKGHFQSVCALCTNSLCKYHYPKKKDDTFLRAVIETLHTLNHAIAMHP
ncbi:hypothetical protein DR999_PMT18811 [Platysternon megacephalum]|uniref:Uncharacterized protein n=1 Tax=Platysternon megacephalum TaxID=55544 RepID=A0A4D9DVN5_9SAUR|nr:hypothetical protein DR999_PMT18811 [Platysternon megacephalum]